MPTIVEEPRVGQGQGTGRQYTEEETAKYNAGWELFAKRMAKRVEGDTRTFRGYVERIGEPHDIPNTHPSAAPGSMRTVRDLRVVLSEPGLEQCAWVTDSADNIRNEKTKLYALYLAVTGTAPPPRWERFTWDTDELTGPTHEVNVVIQKGGPREDGKRGGLKSYVKTFQRLYEDEDDVVLSAPRVTDEDVATAKGLTSRLPGKTAKTPAGSDDELPF
jgi:hypothetical protein